MPKSIFSWSPETYTVQALESISRSANKDDWSAIKAEYTRLRDIAHKRLQRLGKSEFRNTAAYQSHKGDFPKLRDLKPADIPAAMAEMVKFLQAKTSTVSGQKSQRQKTIDAWQDKGLNLTQANYDKVMAIMKEMRTRKILYGSDKVVSVVETVMNKGWDFNKVLNSPNLAGMLKAPSKLKRIRKKAGDSLDSYFNK